MNAKESLKNALSGSTREEIESLVTLFNLTEQEELELVKAEADLQRAKEDSVRNRMDIDRLLSVDKGQRRKEFIKEFRRIMKSYYSSPIDYSSFNEKDQKRAKVSVSLEDISLGFGKCPCPVDGEKTRCCKLKTLDVITQCAFSCSYCSVQAFYNQNKINVVKNLKDKLNSLSLDESIWHIGTGQASDSLFLADDYNTITDLSEFAAKHPNIVIELKSKSGRSDIFNKKWPRNLIFTWSLNAETAIENEERGTAKLIERLNAAEKARDNGSLVGFHIHPMIYFKGWQDEYYKVAKEIEKRFSADDILMISSGTLIFTKENLRFIRESGMNTKILQMEKTLSAGKYTYPFEIKKEMFSHLFSSFSRSFIRTVFTYLCLEDPQLWLPVLGREYQSDREFESDMKRSYLKKINLT